MIEGSPTQVHRCARCQILKPLDDYQPSRRNMRGHRWLCRACNIADCARHRGRNQAYVTEYKLRRGCADCGYNAHPEALEFDHLPGHHKIDKVSNLVASSSFARLLAEIAKCEVVCSNCHAIRTAERGHSAAWAAARRERIRQGLPPMPPAPPDPQMRLDL